MIQLKASNHHHHHYQLYTSHHINYNRIQGITSIIIVAIMTRTVVDPSCTHLMKSHSTRMVEDTRGSQV